MIAIKRGFSFFHHSSFSLIFFVGKNDKINRKLLNMLGCEIGWVNNYLAR
jgi:hypothetical protein